MRYVYGLSTALLIGGATATLVTGYPAGAQVAQNDKARMAEVAPVAGAPASFADLAEHLQPAVVNISTKQQVMVRRGYFGGVSSQERQSLGSGFVISADGYIVTNNHVITADGVNLADSVTIKMSDGTEYPAEIVGRDIASDIAVLKVDAGKPLPFVKFGESKKVRAGDWVIAIGNPFGLGGTVTAGIVSSPYRSTGYGAYDQYIQTDASINSGNSGGPMFDMAGNVIGINKWIIAPGGGNIGIGFSIPADTAAPIVDSLVKGEEIERGYLGVRPQPLTEDFAESLGMERDRGALIQSVEKGEAADKAGIRAGDVIVAVDGKDVTEEQSLNFLLAKLKPGTRVPIDLIRSGKRERVQVLVGKRPSEESLARAAMFENAPEEDEGGPSAPNDSVAIEESLGMRVVPLTPQIAPRLGVDASTRGLVITALARDADAARKGLQPRDIILSANNREVESVTQLESIVAAAKADGRDAVLLRIQRGGQPAAFIAVKIN